MSLPDDRVLELLASDFVVGWHNIEREDYTGKSRGYHRGQTAVGTTNGAGGRNVQLFVLAPDSTVLHALPGFWHPDDLHDELRFALIVHRLWQDPGRDLEAKRALLEQLRAYHMRTRSELTAARSQWQSFDRNTELRRHRTAARDTVDPTQSGPRLKPLHVVVHERVAMQALVPFADFDIEALVDYGQHHYDNNRGIDRPGRPFYVMERLSAARAQAQRRAERRARRRGE